MQAIKALEMIDGLTESSARLTEWECNFLDSLENQVSNTDSISEKQSETLVKIFNDHIDDEYED